MAYLIQISEAQRIALTTALRLCVIEYGMQQEDMLAMLEDLPAAEAQARESGTEKVVHRMCL